MIDGPHGVEYLLAEELPTTTDVRTHRLVRAANTLRERYDFVLLDLGHGGGVEVAMGLELADEAILVSGSAEEDLAETAKTATVVRYHGCRIRGTILSRVPSVQAVDMVGVTERLQTETLAVVPEDDAVREAAADGQSVLRYDPDSDAAMVYWQLAGSLSGSGGLTGPVLPASATSEAAVEEESEASDSRGKQSRRQTRRQSQ
ncbi:MinD/ParA family protein [Natronoarchaeum sp. GCM10025703]|uniref:MinD/ParA family ATP-binding protein n=1 Tax=Natronoarchaeum sp. GCM10025703 TaxID=3252685 RepID=UPI00360D59B8